MNVFAGMNYIRIARWLSACWLMVAGACPGYAQNDPRYLVLFTDKAGSPYAVDRPEEFLTERAIQRRVKQQIELTAADLPVNPNYIAGVKATGAYVYYATRWFNGVVVSANTEQLEAIRELPYFKGIERDRMLAPANLVTARTGVSEQADKFEKVAELDYGLSRTQLELMGVPALHNKGYTGSGMLIGVLDSGFTNADSQDYLTDLYAGGRVLDTYDFVANETNVYNDHSHGLNVLSTIAARKEGTLIGAAFDAGFVLYRTENAPNETLYEEVTWLLAAERADSIGVDIINTSLGYSTFDNAADDYTYADMDGHTAIISRAARMAARTGMLLVISAGNEGNKAWTYITAPADVDSVLTVGAVNASLQRAPFSSIGPNAEGTLKPDVVGLGSAVRVGNSAGGVSSSMGTSFSAPLVSGFAALIWQMHPDKTAQEIIGLLKSMGHQAANPDSELGYGVPYYAVMAIDMPTALATTVSGNVVSLSWRYMPEMDVVYELERSYNGGEFTKIATLTTTAYESDTLYASGEYAYRVRALVVYQQAGAYSEIARVQLVITAAEPEPEEVSLWPNPVLSELHLGFRGTMANGKLTATVISVTGQTMLGREYAAAPEISIPVEGLPPGFYWLRLRIGNDTFKTLKFVKR